MRMTEQQWELYRLSIVDDRPESPRKAAVRGFDTRLKIHAPILFFHGAATTGAPLCGSTPADFY